MKNQLRIKYKKLREELSPDQIEDLSLQIANQTLKLPIWDHSFYHLFLSISEKREINTEPLLHILQGKDKNVVLSKSDFETHSLTNYLLTDTTILKNYAWGIPEPQGGIVIAPEQIEVVFIPLLAFDESGHRIGYGKGFYDRFLSACTGRTVKVGLSFFEAEKEIPGILTSDVPMDFCVTPERIYDFSI